MKLLPDGTIEVDADGTVVIQKGERFPLKCPECAALFPYTESDPVECPRCKTSGDAEDFKLVSYQFLPAN